MGGQLMLAEDEAMLMVNEINSYAEKIGLLLQTLKDGQGWRVLGYTSWTAFLESDELHFSRKHLYELMRAAPVTERLQNEGIKVNHSIANALASYAPEVQIAAAKTGLQRYGALTESRARRIATVIQQAVDTGHVEAQEGQTNALEAALALEDREAGLRQAAYKQPAKLAEFDNVGQAIDWLLGYKGAVIVTVYAA